MLDAEVLCWVCVSHCRNALYTYNAMLQLKGMWVKFGQYLSSRNDLLPDEYVPIYTKLQDRINPRPIDEVRTVIEEDFGRPVAEVFAELDSNALAAASIGQVCALGVCSQCVQSVCAVVSRGRAVRGVACEGHCNTRAHAYVVFA